MLVNRVGILGGAGMVDGVERLLDSSMLIAKRPSHVSHLVRLMVG